MLQAVIGTEIVLGVVVVANLLLTLALTRRMLSARAEHNATGDRPQVLAFPPGARIPDFNAQSMDGLAVTLQRYTREPTVFVCVSPSCEVCKLAMPEFARLAPLTRKAGMELIMVSGGSVLETRDMMKGIEAPYEIICAPRGHSDLFFNWLIPTIPYYFVVDGDVVVSCGGISPRMAGWASLVQSVESGRGLRASDIPAGTSAEPVPAV